MIIIIQRVYYMYHHFGCIVQSIRIPTNLVCSNWKRFPFFICILEVCTIFLELIIELWKFRKNKNRKIKTMERCWDAQCMAQMHRDRSRAHSAQLKVHTDVIKVPIEKKFKKFYFNLGPNTIHLSLSILCT